MNKSRGWLIAFAVVSLVAIFLFYEFGFFDVSLAPRRNVPSVPVQPSCIVPPAYPKLIMQSAVICPGNYNYGIGIGASNVSVKCLAATFTGEN